ncbi:MAG TPA: ribonuclease P protein component [Micromonosporaceae bacterium]|jgi:ribonuclease P protein component|nr:ribonuclease P protein component [Micromonosporaceae bacterium]
MLAAAERLRNRGDFATTVARGRRSARGSIVIHLANSAYSPNAGHTPNPVRSDEPQRPSRAGFVVSRAVGGAVVRNRVRRRLRHLIRPRLAALPAGTDIVVRALPLAATQPYESLAYDLDRALAAASRDPTGRRAT